MTQPHRPRTTFAIHQKDCAGGSSVPGQRTGTPGASPNNTPPPAERTHRTSRKADPSSSRTYPSPRTPCWTSSTATRQPRRP